MEFVDEDVIGVGAAAGTGRDGEAQLGFGSGVDGEAGEEGGMVGGSADAGSRTQTC